MVKVGILNADTPLAGEIIRILVAHPETELVAPIAPALLGRNVSAVHHGLIGEETPSFTDKLNLEDIDFLIFPNYDEFASLCLSKLNDQQDLKLVVLPQEYITDDFAIGLSEINRKTLVRGTTKAFILSPLIAGPLIALVPLAHFLLLNSDIEITSQLPADIVKTLDVVTETKRLKQILNKYQSSFNSDISIAVDAISGSDRAAYSKILFKTSLPVEEIQNIFDKIYDDHNFTFLTGKEPDIKEVEGTQKVIISLKKPDPETLAIEMVYDARMRGGAGDVVHILNLFFGLHEKTGLDMKASRY